MLDVSNEVKTQFLTDSTNKNLKFTTNPDWLYPEDIEFQKDMDTLNLLSGNGYSGGLSWGMNLSSFAPGDYAYFKINHYSVDNADSFDATDYVKTFAFKYRKYVSVSIEVGIYTNSQTYPSQFDYFVTYYDATGTKREKRVSIDLDNYLVPVQGQYSGTLSMILETSSISATGVSKIERIGVFNKDESITFNGEFYYKKLMICVSDDISSLPATYVDTDYSTVNLNEYIPFILFDNDNIVYEDFSLTESLCSKDNIKFGLCEAGNIEVNTCGIQTNNLLGETLYTYYAVDNDNVTIPYDELRRVNWYKGSTRNPSPVNQIYSDSVTSQDYFQVGIGEPLIYPYDEYFSDYTWFYFRYKANIDYFTTNDSVAYVKPYMRYVRSDGLYYTNKYGSVRDINDLIGHDYELIFRPYYTSSDKKISSVYAIGFELYDENQQLISATFDYKINVKSIQIGMLRGYSDTISDFNLSTCYAYNGTIDKYLADRKKEYLPLGKMTVKDIKKKTSHGLVTKKLALYDDMVLLEQNAANWYTSYMYGVDTSTATAYGLQYARQIYSSYFNYMQSIGIESIDNYSLTSIYSKTYSECVSDYMANDYTHFALFRTGADQPPFAYTNIRYSVHTITADPTQLYAVKKINDGFLTDYEIFQNAIGRRVPSDYFDCDTLGRGLISCNVLIKETLSNGSTNCFAVDYNDLFAISANCTSFDIYIPTYTELNQGGTLSEHTNIIKEFTVYKTPKTFTLANADSRLLYYNYLTKEIFECDSTITGRDVVHSILELTGCFFRMSRDSGRPQFVYCVKSGLYPAENLYPADDLFPRMGTSETVPKNKYLSVEYADYEVTRFGKIQIMKKQTSNETDSNVQWQYVGDNDAGLNTYIIDDNIFYCNKDMVYDTEHMTELNDTLEIMYNNISNMNYTPNVTQAIGLPWVECGDRMGLLTTDGGFETFIYRRKLKGIQTLFDTYESNGDEYNDAIKNYGY